ncbi:MAG TPA: hypothetical protein K8U92_02610 [Aliarcobacter thereius]|nr:hypothetical protein [Aliarcobacter thereius]HJE02743.1 hypothetical protein [Aliarcobacter thereius]
MTDKSIKEFAEELGVSKQAIRKHFDKLPTKLTPTYDSENNTTTVTISDSNLALFLASQGIDVPNELYNLARLRSAGVTKIVWHGKARYGNVDIYLSKAFLTNMSRKSRAAIIGALGGLVTGALGGAIIGVIADDIKGKTYKHGKVYVIRKFGYQYSYLQ